MLMGFSVSNYKTFANVDENDYNQIAFVAGRARSKPDHIFKDLNKERSILKTSVILGANSSGKSNLVSAIKTLKTLVTKGDLRSILRTDFKDEQLVSFFETSRDKPIKFSITIKTPSQPDAFSMRGTNTYETGIQYQVYRYELTIKEQYSGDQRTLEWVSEKLYLLDYEHETEVPIFISREASRDYPINSAELSDNAQMKEKKIRQQMRDLQCQWGMLERELVKRMDISFDYNLEKKCHELKTQLNNLDKKIQHIRDELSNKLNKEERMSLEEELITLVQMQERIRRELDSSLHNLENEEKEFNENATRVESLQAQIADLKEQYEYLDESRKRTYAEMHKAFLESNTHRILLLVGCKGGLSALRRYSDVNENMGRKQISAHCNNVFKWFNQTLEVISPFGSVFPPMGPDRIDKLSPIVSKLDLHIKKIGWVEITDKEEINKVLNKISPQDFERVRLCYSESVNSHCGSSAVVSSYSDLYMFSFWNGERVVKKLATFHSEMVPRKLEDESAGTQRIIQLASILLEPEEDKVYVVDELDAKIHPWLMRTFVESFINQSSEHKQLIFTTHDTRLLTTELFRTDEIWFIERVDGYSKIKSLDEMRIKPTGRLEKEYLSGKFGGIPKIS